MPSLPPIYRVASRWLHATADYQSYVDQKRKRKETPLPKDQWEMYVNPGKKDPPKPDSRAESKKLDPKQGPKVGPKDSEPKTPEGKGKPQKRRPRPGKKDRSVYESNKDSDPTKQNPVPVSVKPPQDVLDFADDDSATGQLLAIVEDFDSGSEPDVESVKTMQNLLQTSKGEVERASQDKDLKPPTLDAIRKTEEVIKKIEQWMQDNEDLIATLLDERSTPDKSELKLTPEAERDSDKAVGNSPTEKDKSQKAEPDKGKVTTSKPLPKQVKDMLQKFVVDEAEVRKVVQTPEVQRPELSDAARMQAFRRKAKPEMRERMKGMTVAEFKAMVAAIMDEEEGKTAALRAEVIKAAYMYPEHRFKLLSTLEWS